MGWVGHQPTFPTLPTLPTLPKSHQDRAHLCFTQNEPSPCASQPWGTENGLRSMRMVVAPPSAVRLMMVRSFVVQWMRLPSLFFRSWSCQGQGRGEGQPIMAGG